MHGQQNIKLSGIIGTANHPDMQKIRITGFLFDSSYIGSLKWGKKFYKRLFRPRIYLRTNKTLIHNSLYLFDNWGKTLSIKKM
jgi:hypothetical protein